jgi:hypothetical protein
MRAWLQNQLLAIDAAGPVYAREARHQRARQAGLGPLTYLVLRLAAVIVGFAVALALAFLGPGASVPLGFFEILGVLITIAYAPVLIVELLGSLHPVHDQDGEH